VKPFLVAVLACGIWLILGCSEEPTEQDDTTHNAGTSFRPTPDSSLTPLQVERWVRATQALDALSEAYRDSFDVEAPSERLRLQKRFQEQQQRVCEAQGLTGGYAEYRWILGALANPRNKALRDSFSVAFHK